jgi:hypothetical protein
LQKQLTFAFIRILLNFGTSFDHCLFPHPFPGDVNGQIKTNHKKSSGKANFVYRWVPDEIQLICLHQNFVIFGLLNRESTTITEYGNF